MEDRQEILIQCVFGSRKSNALVISDVELHCGAPLRCESHAFLDPGTSPPVDGAYSPTGHLASFELETIPAPAMVKGPTPGANQLPLKQLTFYYRRFVPSISWVAPCTSQSAYSKS